MVLVVAAGYPTDKAKYSNGFVHARVKAYLEQNIDAKVFIISKKKKKAYEYEGVHVVYGTSEDLYNYVNAETTISCICFHFLTKPMLSAIERFRHNVSVIIFVHGNEALFWYERIFPDTFADCIRILKFLKYVFVNTYTIHYIRKRINNLKVKVDIVCVSQWMKRIMIKNWKVDTDKINIEVIPNIINEKLFPYCEKSGEDRYNILLIRSFSNGKYALDIAQEIIRKVERYPESKKIRFTIIGDGWLHEKYTCAIKNFSNVEIKKQFLSQREIAEYHRRNGIFICPTRQDAQGVSMCEAMSSGLVPIASNNTAIPEFLPKKFNLMFDNADDAANRIIELIGDEEQFQSLSMEVSKFIRKKCCIENTIGKEIKLIRKISF